MATDTVLAQFHLLNPLVVPKRFVASRLESIGCPCVVNAVNYGLISVTNYLTPAKAFARTVPRQFSLYLS